jgi:SAM-dependent methyltransferase
MIDQGHDDARLHAPAAERNKGPILEVLRRTLPQAGVVLEIASGTGQHVAYFAAALPHLVWQPSDLDARVHASIRAWSEELTNVHPPIALDVRQAWPLAHADAVLCSNMIHISPWEAALALIDGAGRVLPPGGVLFLYGPYRRFGRHTAASNAAFDASLRATDAQWGVRDLEAVEERAGAAGLHLEEIVEMPANNLSVVFRKQKTPPSS